MPNAQLPSAQVINHGKSFFRFRFLFILWAVCFSLIISYFIPPEPPESGYRPVFQSAEVKGTNTERARASAVTKPAFVSEEIEEKKVTPTQIPTATPTPEPTKKDFGKSRQIGEYTWTIDVPDEERSGTADEVFQALNAYRRKNGQSELKWDNTLASYARSRADSFASNEKTDSHVGFKDYLNNQDGFTKLGYMKIGENSSYGYKVSGGTLIESVYAGDKPHDDNQLSSDWSAVGIGVNGLSTNLIFAGSPL